MQEQPKAKTKAEKKFDAAAKRETAKQVKKAEKYNAKRNLNGN